LLTLAIAITCCLPFDATAEPAPGIDTAEYFMEDGVRYVTDYFGTRMEVTMEQPLPYDQETGYWSEALPEEMLFGYEHIIRDINASRAGSGLPQIDALSFPVQTWSEEEVDLGWRYTIKFAEMTPDEAIMFMDALGGADTLFPDAFFEFYPVLEHTFNAYSESYEMPFKLNFGSYQYTFDNELLIDEYMDEIKSAMLDAYGQEPELDVYYGCSLTRLGDVFYNLTITATLPAG
jgi:hypothetical protein